MDRGVSEWEISLVGHSSSIHDLSINPSPNRKTIIVTKTSVVFDSTNVAAKDPKRKSHISWRRQC